MTDVTLYGFSVSTYVDVVRLMLTHKGVAPHIGKPVEHAGARATSHRPRY